MRSIDSLGGGINCVDWAAGDFCIYGRAWDLLYSVYSVWWLGLRGVRGDVVCMGSVDIMGGGFGGLIQIVRVGAINWLESGAIGVY